MAKIALIQGENKGSREENVAWTVEQIRRAAAEGAEIVCTQELFTTSYFCTVEDPDLFDLAESIPGETTEALCEVAALCGVVVVGALFERRAAGVYHNTAVVIDADGSLLGTYRKNHIPQDPGFEEKFYFTPGDQGYPVWKTKFGTIGVLICWDQWFPEGARLMALAGAEILFYPTAIGWLPEEKEELGAGQHHAWQTVQCGHAVANGCYVAAINRVGREDGTEFWGQSFVSDFMGRVVARGSVDQCEIVTVDCDRQALEDHRRWWPFFRDRRIETYRDLGQRWLG
ncbi:carbon-nitrogen hydrolase [Roseibacillus ishigakijimensis]|uniref:Carbon-nitrogen hydrolase n=1 Tax=Roseibacillus ishigakijimensis TaxID=454146 RepID=A0A934VL80_9BACT|nr:carbon-nitrogen hydrolase [Roseibacillus ishigakijimensis]MBK1832846.1 carbon-nitrogen hydrolase [Roseibacillus ishigakijimensis]